MIGTRKNIYNTMKLIMLKLRASTAQSSGVLSSPSGESGAEAESIVLRWAIPQSNTGLLIGKAGARIKQINQQVCVEAGDKEL